MWRAAGLILCFSGSIAMAEPVVLISNDGYISLEGDLVEVDNNFYVLKTSVGEVKIPVSDVSCRGADCPVDPVSSVDQIPPEFTLNQQERLFGRFLDWYKNKEDIPSQYDDQFRRFLEWHKKNAN